MKQEQLYTEKSQEKNSCLRNVASDLDGGNLAVLSSQKASRTAALRGFWGSRAQYRAHVTWNVSVLEPTVGVTNSDNGQPQAKKTESS